MTESTPHPKLAPLAPFVGEWEVRALIPGTGSAGAHGSATFEWILGGRYLLHRSSVDQPDTPDTFSIIAPSDGGFRQHYFDSRGIVRLYSMTFEDGQWTLLREAEDFSPMHFMQRYVGVFEDDGNTIRGRWEARQPGEEWQLDFELIYRRVLR